jgi:hypothetical protein
LNPVEIGKIEMVVGPAAAFSAYQMSAKLKLSSPRDTASCQVLPWLSVMDEIALG